MRIQRPRRQIVLFLIVITLPAAVVIDLGLRTVFQERELAAKRVVDRRQDAVEQVRRELLARLDAIKLQEINRLIRSPRSDQPQPPDNPAVIFVARVDGDRLILPWEMAAAGPSVSFAFAGLLQEGEALELGKKDDRAAAVAYRQALVVAASHAEKTEARLLLARALAKAGNADEAVRNYGALLEDNDTVRDEFGVGYSFYAADRLTALRRETAAVLEFLERQLRSDHWLTLPELYLVRGILRALPAVQSERVLAAVSPRIAQMEQVAAMARDFPRVRAQIESGTGAAVWVAYADEPWLVTMVPPTPPLPAVVVAVSSARVAPPAATLVGRAISQGESLGESFPGLRVKFPDGRFQDERRGSSIALWVAGLGLVLGLTLFGGYLLLRDVNRDIRMTEMRSQFVAGVSHELKTPLTAIRMFAETLALGRARDPHAQSEYLETIVNESERLARLVDNVLDFSKIDEGKKIYRPRMADLADVVDSAVRSMQYPLAQQGFTLNLSVHHNLPPVRVDPDAIQQAVLNLLTNAMKYSGDAREIDLHLSARNGDAVIAVIDRGLGLEPQEQKRVFDKFYRAPSHESRLIAGTGLGLTLVAHIVEAHGGRVELQSAPGAGSTFSILIPLNGALEGHA